MAHSLEWSQAFLGRMKSENLTAHNNKAAELHSRLKSECASGLLPFLTFGHLPQFEQDLEKILPTIKSRKHMLVLGIGGSALGARALQKAFAPCQDEPCHSGPYLWIADNVGATSFMALLSKLPAEDTTVVCISKSGGTIETISQYFLAKDWLSAKLGDKWSQHLILVTDKNNGFLRQEANKDSKIATMEVPDNMGGRYSVLSAVGLLPAAFMGMDWQALMAGAKEVAQSIQTTDNLANHPAFKLAAWGNVLEECGYSQLIFFCYIPYWATFGPWFAQLWAESLGKGGRGIQPVPSIGVTDQHSVNQMFLDGQRDKGCIFLTANSEVTGPKFNDLPEKWAWLNGRTFGDLLPAEALGTRMALCKNNVPLVHLNMAKDDIKSAGALIVLLESATLLAGWLMGLNPLDQPAVELGKRLANARLGAANLQTEEADLKAFLERKVDEQTF